MCGILATRFEHTAPKIIAERGKAGVHTASRSGFCISHALHAIVGNEPQPFEGTGVFAANCEIYNWREIASEHDLAARNDAHLLFLLLEQLPDGSFDIGYRDTSIAEPRSCAIRSASDLCSTATMRSPPLTPCSERSAERVSSSIHAA